jgi:hypothetical protein
MKAAAGVRSPGRRTHALDMQHIVSIFLKIAGLQTEFGYTQITPEKHSGRVRPIGYASCTTDTTLPCLVIQACGTGPNEHELDCAAVY